ncbi:MAG: Ribosomal protein S6 modification protein [bacterium ADurb.Bin212]|nr:MAG: Ribosomal protein S6 modification protein [bacterium ADurb.Bin212]
MTAKIHVGIALPGSKDELSLSSKLLIDCFSQHKCNVTKLKLRNIDIIASKDKINISSTGAALEPFDVFINRHNVLDRREHDFAVARLIEDTSKVVLNPLSKSFFTHNKFHANSLLQNFGIPIPKIYKPGLNYNSDDIIETIGLPLILKANTGNQGKGVVYIDNKLSLISIIDCLINLNEDFFLQEFVLEAAADCPRAVLIGGELIAAYGRSSKKDDFRAKLKDGKFGGFMKISEKDQEVFKKIYKLTELDILGIDFCVTDHGIKIIEVNAYPGLGNIYKASGLNLAENFYQHAINRLQIKT